MKKKIYRNVCLLLIAAVVLAVSGVFAIYAASMVNVGKSRVYDKAQYLKTYMENTAEQDYKLNLIDRVSSGDKKSRITLIEPNGTVVFDNEANPEKMENHSQRKEFIEASSDGIGTDQRKSETLGETVYYCAVRLNDGYVLRVSENHSSVAGLAVSVVVELILILIIMCIAAVIVSSRLAKNIVEPINRIDINNISDIEVYPEMQPFVERIKKDNAERDKTEQIRREFSANVSHELRTPMTTISGYAQMISNGMARPEDVKLFGEKIEKESERLILLINDIINLSKLDETNEISMPEKINLKDIAKQVISNLTDAAAKKAVSIYLNGTDVVITANRTMLYEMIYNITDNAVKYNKDGGRVTISTNTDYNGASIMVADTGIGIPKEEQERIFERFYRVDKSHSKKIGGTGLGLSIVKHAAMVHNANIDLKSTPGVGTTITIQFPKG